MARLEDQDPDRIAGGAVSLPETAGIQVWRASARALICGYVDAYSLLSFGVYVSFMTGNTTSGGAHIAEIKLAAAGHSLLPIPFFLLGALIGTLLVEADELRALYRLSSLVGSMLLIEVAAAYLGSPGWGSIMILSGAMGLVNTSVTKVGGQAVSLGFMTGDLNNLARQLALAIRHKPVPQANGSLSRRGRVSLLAGLWTSFITGAVLGAMLLPGLGLSTPILPAIALLILAQLEHPRFPSVARARDEHAS